MYQHERKRSIPLLYDEFDYFDNKYLEWYVCKHSGVIYKEQDFFDAVGYGVWAEVATFDFKCAIT